MRFRRNSMCSLAGWILLWLVVAESAHAELKLDQVRAMKKATALVLSGQGKERGQGSAFCVAPGFFVTNAHVVKDASAALKLVLDSGEKEQRIIPAKVVRSDEEMDFALLKLDGAVEGVDAIPVLDLGASEDLVETLPLTAFGFPFGTALVFDKADYPSVSVSVGRVTSLRKKQGVLERIQLDASLNPGNSGGAVVDDNGRVVGVVQAGIPGAGLNFAIPSATLKKFLDRPEVTLTVPGIPPDKKHDEYDLVVSVQNFQKIAGQWTVEFTVGSGAAQAAESVNNVAKFRFIPVPKPVGPKQFRIVCKFASGVLVGQVDDQSLTVGSEKIELARIRRIDKSAEQVLVTLTDSKGVTGSFAEQKTTVRLGPTEVTIDLAQADSVVVESLDKPVENVTYKLQIKDGDRSLASLKGTIDFLKPGAPATPTTQSLTASSSKSAKSTDGPKPIFPKAADSPVEDAGGDSASVKLPGLIDDVVAGNGGRYLFFLLKQVGKVAVFDVEERRIAKYLTVAAGEVAIAASDSVLLVLQKDRGILDRYSLATLERELSVPFNDSGVPQSLHLGYSSQGPALLMTDKGVRLVDLKTLRPLAQSDKSVTGRFYGGNSRYELRASGDGTTFGGWQLGVSPS